MGIDVDLIVGNYGKEDYICAVCTDLLEDPITLKACEHMFCRACIDEVIRTGESRCPVCRTRFSSPTDVTIPIRLVRKYMSRIRVFRCKKINPS